MWLMLNFSIKRADKFDFTIMFVGVVGGSRREYRASLERKLQTAIKSDTEIN